MAGNSYVIRPLLAADPRRPRNVALISAGDLSGALTAMFASVRESGDTVNAAVWQNTASPMSAQETANLAEWCRDIGFNVTQEELGRRKNFRCLSRLFNRVAASAPDRKAAKATLGPLENHIRGRLEAFAAAFPEKGVQLTVRASLFDTRTNTAHEGNPHVDGGAQSQERFIETLAGGATCLIDNDDVAFATRVEKIRLKTGTVNYWQVPTGSLTMLTTLQNYFKPVMHTPPPRETMGADDVRVVVIYDLIEREKGLIDYIPALRR